MKAGLATVSIAGTLGEKIAAIAAAGFDTVELCEGDVLASGMSPSEVATRVADAGLQATLYQPFRDFEQVAPDLLRANLSRAERTFERMHQLGIRTMLLCSNVESAIADDDALAVAQLGALALLAERNDVEVAYEALSWGRNVSTFDHAWRLVRAVDSPAVGLCLDSFHILARGADLDMIAGIPGHRIMALQLADAARLDLDLLTWSRHHRLLPGQGEWDLPAFLERVLDTGYAGPLSLEIFNDGFRQADPFPTARSARRSLTALESAARQRSECLAPRVTGR